MADRAPLTGRYHIFTKRISASLDCRGEAAYDRRPGWLLARERFTLARPDALIIVVATRSERAELDRLAELRVAGHLILGEIDLVLRGLVLGAMVAAVAGGLAMVGRLRGTGPEITVATLRPPAEYVTGMTPFLKVENDRSTRLGRGRPDSVPVHGTAIWGYYISAIDEEPWKSQLLMQQEAITHHRDWPALPISGPILEDVQFRSRLLELYVAVHVMPNQAWALYRWQGLRQSGSDSSPRTESSCSYGQDCLMFTTTVEGLAEPNQEQRVWQWRTGRIVISVSALGAPNWQEDQITPLLQYYADKVSTMRDIHGGDDSLLPPSPALSAQ